jgi:deoxyadenosine/deoxycytidine kinase
MSRKPIVIIFIGNVGAGKTTHISLTYSLLKKRGCKVYKTYVKTFFIITPLLSRLHLLRKNIWRITVSLDLLLNSIYLPLITWVRTILFPKIARKQIVLVEEHLPGSLVDYVHASLILGLSKISLSAIKLLIKLSRKNTWHKIIYVMADKSLLPKRWSLRGSPYESKTYLLTQDLIFKIVSAYNDTFYINTNKDLLYNKHIVENFTRKIAC